MVLSFPATATPATYCLEPVVVVVVVVCWLGRKHNKSRLGLKIDLRLTFC